MLEFSPFSPVFHRSVDHPLGRTHPPHPVLCLHRPGTTDK